MSEDNAEKQGERLLTAVERLVDDCDNLIAQVESFGYGSSAAENKTDPLFMEFVAGRIIRSYSTKAALVGGAAALPAMLPGPGSLVAIVGGSLADTAFMLKHEVEMALSLTYLYGYDIREERERWLAYVLAGVSTYEASGDRNYFLDLAEAELEALALYTPRQLSKMAITLMGKIALRQAPKGLARGLPVLGVAVGLTANKFLTSTAGWKCVDALQRRRASENKGDGPIVEATVSGAGDKPPASGEEAPKKEKEKKAKGKKAADEAEAAPAAEAKAEADAGAAEEAASEAKESEE